MAISLPLENGTPDGAAHRAYGAKSEAGVFVGDLLMREVPTLASGDLEIVAIARRPGVQSKVAVRRRPSSPRGQPVALQLAIGADHLRRVRAQLDQEAIHIVGWHRDQRRYVAGALGLGHTPPPMTLMAFTRQAQVMLGEIDFRGVPGWRAVNLVLASTLTGWRIRLFRVAETGAWQALQRAREQATPVTASVVGRRPGGLLVVVHGLDAILPFSQIRGVDRRTPPEAIDALLEQRLGDEGSLVNVLRLDPDEGRIVVSERIAPPGQLALPL